MIFLSRVAVSPSQPQGHQRAHSRDNESNCNFQLKKQLLFQQKKHTCKLPCQLASQGCQTHLAPKEAQKSKLKKLKSKIYFYHCQSIFFMVSPPWVGLHVSL